MKIMNKAALQDAITELEGKKIRQEAALFEQYKLTRDSLRPVNLLKNGFNEIIEMPALTENILKTVAGLGIGVLSKKLFLGNSSSIIRKVVSGFLELAVAKTAITNADKVKAYGISLYNNLFKHSNNNHNHIPSNK